MVPSLTMCTLLSNIKNQRNSQKREKGRRHEYERHTTILKVLPVDKPQPGEERCITQDRYDASPCEHLPQRVTLNTAYSPFGSKDFQSNPGVMWSGVSEAANKCLGIVSNMFLEPVLPLFPLIPLMICLAAIFICTVGGRLDTYSYRVRDSDPRSVTTPKGGRPSGCSRSTSG